MNHIMSYGLQQEKSYAGNDAASGSLKEFFQIKYWKQSLGQSAPVSFMHLLVLGRTLSSPLDCNGFGLKYSHPTQIYLNYCSSTNLLHSTRLLRNATNNLATIYKFI